MKHFPEGELVSNRGLATGCVVTEIRLHPFINGEGKDWYWDYKEERVHFEILDVGRVEYECRYLDTEDRMEFYWPFWDRQPGFGFWIDGSSPVRYYTTVGESPQTDEQKTWRRRYRV